MTTQRIGLTGGIACGKSVVSERLRAHGIPVLDTDQLAHALLKPGNPVFDEVCAHFGRGILGPDGGIDRALLGKRVFGDSAELEALNRLMHPEIGRQWRAWMASQNAPLAVVVIPLLFETGVEKEFDGVLCISAAETTMIERLKNRNLTEEEAVLRIRAQMPVALKARKATWTLHNNRTLSDLLEQVDSWVKPWIPQEN